MTSSKFYKTGYGRWFIPHMKVSPDFHPVFKCFFSRRWNYSKFCLAHYFEIRFFKTQKMYYEITHCAPWCPIATSETQEQHCLATSAAIIPAFIFYVDDFFPPQKNWRYESHLFDRKLIFFVKK